MQAKVLSQIAMKGYCLKAAYRNIKARVRLVPDAEHDTTLLQSFKPSATGWYQFLRSLIYVWVAELISRLRYPAYVNKGESCNSEITHTCVTFTGIWDVLPLNR